MTTIAYRDGVLAADSQTTIQTEAGGSRKFRCTPKLLTKNVLIDGEPQEVIIALAGESAPGLAFFNWFDGDFETKDTPEIFVQNLPDFTALVLFAHGLYEFDAYCTADKIIEPFYAIGSGAKAALGAMHAGATAEQAVEIACKVDPYTSGPVQVVKLQEA